MIDTVRENGGITEKTFFVKFCDPNQELTFSAGMFNRAPHINTITDPALTVLPPKKTNAFNLTKQLKFSVAA